MHLANGSQLPLVSTRQMLPAPIKRLEVHDDLSLYELDTACRLSSVIRDMIDGSASGTYVYLHIPKPEYLLVMFGHQRGLSGGRVMKEWLTAVDHRAARIDELFKAFLTPATVDIRAGSPLDDSLMPYLRETIRCGYTPKPHELADVIRHSNAKIADVFEHWLRARGDKVEFDYYDLAQFGYLAGVIANLTQDSLVIEVDNPSEEPIFKAVSRVMRRAEKDGSIWSGNVMAAYPYEQMASWHGAPTDWRPVTKGAVNGDAVQAIMSQYGIDLERRDYVDKL